MKGHDHPSTLDHFYLLGHSFGVIKCFFLAELSVRSPQNYLFSLSKKNFSRSKHPKHILFNFEKGSTGQVSYYSTLSPSLYPFQELCCNVKWTVNTEWEDRGVVDCPMEEHILVEMKGDHRNIWCCIQPSELIYESGNKSFSPGYIHVLLIWSIAVSDVIFGCFCRLRSAEYIQSSYLTYIYGVCTLCIYATLDISSGPSVMTKGHPARPMIWWHVNFGFRICVQWLIDERGKLGTRQNKKFNSTMHSFQGRLGIYIFGQAQRNNQHC